MEFEILGQLRHKNLLSLRGYCVEDGATHTTTRVKGTLSIYEPPFGSEQDSDRALMLCFDGFFMSEVGNYRYKGMNIKADCKKSTL